MSKILIRGVFEGLPSKDIGLTEYTPVVSLFTMKSSILSPTCTIFPFLAIPNSRLHLESEDAKMYSDPLVVRQSNSMTPFRETVWTNGRLNGEDFYCLHALRILDYDYMCFRSFFFGQFTIKSLSDLLKGWAILEAKGNTFAEPFDEGFLEFIHESFDLLNVMCWMIRLEVADHPGEGFLEVLSLLISYMQMWT